MVMMDERCQFVFFHDGVWDDRDGDAHVFVLFHGSVKIEVLQIGSHELGIGGGDHAIEEDFDGSEIGGLGADITIILDAVAADGEAYTARVWFFRAEGSNNTEVGGFFAFWDGCDGDEEHGIGAGGHVLAMALAESAEFIFAGFNPEGAFTAFAEFNVVGKLTSVRVEGIAMEGKVVEGGGGGSAGGRGNGRSGGSKVDMLVGTSMMWMVGG